MGMQASSKERPSSLETSSETVRERPPPLDPLCLLPSGRSGQSDGAARKIWSLMICNAGYSQVHNVLQVAG